MKLRSMIVAAAAVAVVGGATIAGTSAVVAQTDGDSLVERIASRFNLNQDEVQGVVDELREERRAEKQQMFSDRLQEKVDDGTITAEQKTLIEEKMAELRERKEELKDSDLSREEVREQMATVRDELEQWAEDNDIPVEELMPFGKGHRGHGFKRGFGGFDRSES